MNEFDKYTEEYERLLNLPEEEIRRFYKTYDDHSGIFRNNDDFYFYDKGVVHREGDMPAILTHNQFRFMILDRPHRENGPAIINLDGSHEYYKNGRLHRTDGPCAYNSAYDEYLWRTYKEGYFQFNDYTYEMNEWVKQCGFDLENLTEEERFLIKIKMETLSNE